MRRIIVSTMMGGVGNQLFIYFATISLAHSYRSDVSFDHSHYFLFDRYSRRPVLNILGITYRKKFSVLCFLSHLPFVRALLFRLSLLVNENSKCYDKNILIMRGYWQSAKYFDLNRKAIRSLVNFDFPIPNEYADIASQMTTCESVCLHIRSYSETNGILDNEILTPDYYNASIQYLSRITSSPFFFIFSDSEILPKDIQLPPGRFFFVMKNQENVNDDLAHLYLMTKCHNFICSNSSFSWWAAYLSNSNTVVYPDRMGRKIYPEPLDEWHII